MRSIRACVPVRCRGRWRPRWWTAARCPSKRTDGILSLDDLETQFHVGGRIYRAVNGVSLSVTPGECLGLIGESGSGKSVTALSVMGLVASPPGVITGGAVRYNGDDLIGMRYAELRRLRGDRIAYIFQDPQATLHPLYRVGDQLAEAIRSHHRIGKSEAHKRVLDLLALRPHPQPRKPRVQLSA